MKDRKIKIQIKNRLSRSVIFEYEAEGNTLMLTVVEAIKAHVALCNADLRGADLRGADLCDANLCDANLCDADLRGANLCDADLCDADLRGANFTGVVLDYDDTSAGYSDINGLVKKITENSNLRPTSLHENHDAFASHWEAFWRNLIIIRKWEVVKKEDQKINLTDDQKSIVKAFAKMHDAQLLRYRECIYENCSCLVVPNVCGGEKIIDFPGNIEGLKDQETYTLAELGIE